MNDGRLLQKSCCSALLLVSCTQPHFPEGDAEIAQAGATQLAEGLTAELPAWAESLPGRYFYAADAFTQSRILQGVAPVYGRRHDVGLATIREDERGVWLETSICKSVANANLGTVSVRSKAPQSLETSRHRVLFATDAERFQTEPYSPTYYGAEKDPPAECKGHEGERIPHVAEQVWLSPGDTCFCDFDSEISRADDCRIRDGDMDGFPGITSIFQGSSLCNKEYFSVERNAGRLLQGTSIGEGRYRAFLEMKASPLELSWPGNCTANLADSESCATSRNPIILHRLPADADFTCEDLIDSESKLFDAPEPFPTGQTCGG